MRSMVNNECIDSHRGIQARVKQTPLDSHWVKGIVMEPYFSYSSMYLFSSLGIQAACLECENQITVIFFYMEIPGDKLTQSKYQYFVKQFFDTFQVWAP